MYRRSPGLELSPYEYNRNEYYPTYDDYRNVQTPVRRNYSRTGISNYQSPTNEEPYRPVRSEITLDDPLRKDFENLRRNLESVRERNRMKRAASREYLNHALRDLEHRTVNNENAPESSLSDLNRSVERRKYSRWGRDAENQLATEERFYRSNSRDRLKIADYGKPWEQERFHNDRNRSPRNRQNLREIPSNTQTAYEHYGIARENPGRRSPSHRARFTNARTYTEVAKPEVNNERSIRANSPLPENNYRKTESEVVDKKRDSAMEGIHQELLKLREETSTMREELSKIKSNFSKEVINTLKTFQTQGSPKRKSPSHREIRESGTPSRLETSIHNRSFGRQSLQRVDSKRASPHGNALRRSIPSEMDRSLEARRSQKQSPGRAENLKLKEAIISPKSRKFSIEHENPRVKSATKGRFQHTEDLIEKVKKLKEKVLSQLNNEQEIAQVHPSGTRSKTPSLGISSTKFDSAEQPSSRRKKSQKTPKAKTSKLGRTPKSPEGSAMPQYGLVSRLAAELNQLAGQSQEGASKPIRNKSALGKREKR